VSTMPATSSSSNMLRAARSRNAIGQAPPRDAG
jgi:hypothetical protein